MTEKGSEIRIPEELIMNKIYLVQGLETNSEAKY